MYVLSRYRETPNYSAFNCKLNIPQVTSFKELNCKAVNKVFSVFQTQLNFDISVIAFQKLCTILGSLVVIYVIAMISGDKKVETNFGRKFGAMMDSCG